MHTQWTTKEAGRYASIMTRTRLRDKCPGPPPINDSQSAVNKMQAGFAQKKDSGQQDAFAKDQKEAAVTVAHRVMGATLRGGVPVVRKCQSRVVRRMMGNPSWEHAVEQDKEGKRERERECVCQVDDMAGG